MIALRTVAVLSHAPFRYLWLAQLVSQTFLNVLIFSQLLRVYDLTQSNTGVALMVLAVGVPNLLFGAIAGVLVDLWDKKLVMFSTQILRLLVVLAFLLAWQNPVWIYFLMFLIASLTQFWGPAQAGIIPRLVPARELLAANSFYTLTFLGTVILGNVLAGPILDIFGPQGTYLLVAAAFFPAAFWVALLPGKALVQWSRPRLAVVGRVRGELWEGINFIRSHPTVSMAVSYLAISQTLIATLSAVAPGFAVKIISLRTNDASLLVLFPAALGMVVGAVVVSQFFHTVDRDRLIRFGLVSCGLTLVAFSLVSRLALFLRIPAPAIGIVILFLLGAANAFLDIPANTALQENSPDRVRARVYGILTALVGAAAVFPVMLAGTLADIFGVERVVFGLGAAILALSWVNGRKYG